MRDSDSNIYRRERRAVRTRGALCDKEEPALTEPEPELALDAPEVGGLVSNDF